MVHLVTLPNQVQARILAARLGAEGLLWQLRGESSVYPMTPVEVLVEADGLATARALLSAAAADAVEPRLDEAGDTVEPRARHPWQGTVLAVVTVLLILLLAARPLLFR